MAVNLVEDFDGAFQNCLSAIMTQEHFNVSDTEETKASVDQCVQKFVDIAKQLESFFLQKRLMLSVHKPEQIIKEDINELKLELQRKELLIQKHNDKLQVWQTILNRQTSSQGQQPQGQGQQQQQAQAGQSQSPAQAGAVTSTPAQSMTPGHHQSSSPAQATPQLQQQHSQPGLPLSQQMPVMSMGAPGGQQMSHPQQLQHQTSFPQGPLAYLEQTTSNIGMPERR